MKVYDDDAVTHHDYLAFVVLDSVVGCEDARGAVFAVKEAHSHALGIDGLGFRVAVLAHDGGFHEQLQTAVLAAPYVGIDNGAGRQVAGLEDAGLLNVIATG